MPRRKPGSKQPPFAFVRPQVASLLRPDAASRSSAIRRHAAYWGGPMKHSRNASEKPADEAKIEKTSSTDDTDPWELEPGTSNAQTRMLQFACQQSSRSTSVSACWLLASIASEASHPPMPSLNYQLPYAIDLVALLMARSLDYCAPLAGDLVKMLVDQSPTPAPHVPSVIVVGCILLTVAQSMAVTGQGQRVELLELKAQVLRFVSKELSEKPDAPNWECMAAIMLLGSPIVCLLSQNLPNGLGLGGYIQASALGKEVCCPEAAAITKCAAQERRLHWQHLHEMLLRASAPKHQAHQEYLLDFLYRYRTISMYFEAERPLDTIPPAKTMINDKGDRGDEADALRSQWSSPLAAQRVPSGPALGVDTPTDALVKITHDWISTFIDQNDQPIKLTSSTIWHRMLLRRTLEQFQTLLGKVTTQEDAVYASCWWASSVLLKADQLQVSLATAAEHTRMQPRLVKCLRMTDLTHLWGIRRGLLFWVTSVCHLVTVDRCLPLLTTALYAHFAHEMASNDFLYRIGISQLRRLRSFESLCVQGPRTDNESISNDS